MFSIFKTKSGKDLDCSFLGVDMHAHLLPGIDDGAKTLQDSVEMIRALQELGYDKLIVTPHIMSEYYPNTPEDIQTKLEEVRAAITKEGIPVEIEAAAEYYIDEGFEEKIKKDQQLLTFGSRHILVEFSMLSEPINGMNILFQLVSKGYTPILAHPERYTYWAKQLDQFAKIKAMGVQLQVNLLSMGGYYGPLQKKLGRQLLDAHLVDYLGTDLHRILQLDIIRKVIQDRRLRKRLDTLVLNNRSL